MLFFLLLFICFIIIIFFFLQIAKVHIIWKDQGKLDLFILCVKNANSLFSIFFFIFFISFTTSFFCKIQKYTKLDLFILCVKKFLFFLISLFCKMQKHRQDKKIKINLIFSYFLCKKNYKTLTLSIFLCFILSFYVFLCLFSWI